MKNKKLFLSFVAAAALLLISFAYKPLSLSESTAVKHLRAKIKSTILPGAPTHTVEVSDLMTLENIAGAKSKDKAYEKKYHPDEIKIKNEKVKEGDLVTIKECWIHLVGSESDNDYHIQISGSKSNTTACLIIEIPPKSSDKKLSAQFKVLRKKLEKYHTDKLLPQPLHATVTGQFFFDDDHVEKENAGGRRGKDGMKATNLWEVHPVTDLTMLN